MPSETLTDSRCNYEYTPGDKYDHDSGYCEAHPMDNGRCYHHGGQRENGGAPGDNDNAADHEAFREFFEEALTDGESQALRQAERLLDEPGSAQEVARTAAGIALVQFRRSGDERFLRRFESICDTFAIAPEEAQQIEVGGTVEHDHEHGVDEATRDLIDDLAEDLKA